MNFTRSLPLRLASGLGALALGAAVTGCGVGTVNTASSPVEGTLQIQGKVHGGEQPINGSVIKVYAAGTTGYGTGAASIMNTGVTVSTDSNGFFQLTGKYTCPSSTSLVYITATGGDPGIGSSNAAIKLASAIGTCAQLQTASYVWINELTTAATAFALAQYYGAASGGFGAPNTVQAQLGLSNAIATVGNLVNSTNGTAVTTATTTNSLGTITITPDATKLGTVANILAACVNSDGGSTSACQTTLFPDVTPTGGTAPTDTLGAAVLMNTNPTSNNSNGSTANITALYGLQTATSPFSGLSAQPADWTVGISYSAGTSTTQTLINGANDIAVDSNGNVWIINYNSGATATESMAEFSPIGTPLANPFNSGAALPASMSGSSPRNMAIDTNNNVFATSSSSSSYIFEWNPTSSTSTSYGIGSQGYGIAIDGSNNLYITHNSGTTYTLAEFPGGTLAATNRVEYPFNSVSQYMTVNTAGVPYFSNATTQTSIMAVTGTNPGTCTTYPCTTANDTSLTATYTTAASGMSTPFGLAPAAGGAVWGTNSGTTSVVYINGGTATQYGSSTSFAAPRKVAVDGNNVAWVLNRTNGGVSEITTTGTILSPASTIGFVHSGTGAVTGIATDPSGNVWIANGAVGAATGGDSIFEIVGVAAPTVTPISLAIKNGTVGVKP